MAERIVIDESSVPRFRPGNRFKHDEARGQWVILSPERMSVLDDIGAEIVKGIDGETTVGAMVDTLAARFNAPRDQILGDVLEYLQDFTDKGVLSA